MIIDGECPFDPVDTFECGQCFRWNCTEDGTYTGISDGKICRVKGREIICPKGDEEYWRSYFALDIDYRQIMNTLLKTDETLKPCIDFGSGIRILKQDLWETTVSFIISANNNIPRIKKIIETMCELYGDKISDGDEIFYAFPTAERLAALSEEDLAPLRAGYRDKYILDAARKAASGEVDFDAIAHMSDLEAKKELMKIKGVGGKVADCIMLFSLGRFSVFPTDVWIKRILGEVYGVEDKNIQSFVAERFGSYAGYAQQYLYYYYRSLGEAAAKNG